MEKLKTHVSRNRAQVADKKFFFCSSSFFSRMFHASTDWQIQYRVCVPRNTNVYHRIIAVYISVKSKGKTIITANIYAQRTQCII